MIRVAIVLICTLLILTSASALLAFAHHRPTWYQLRLPNRPIIAVTVVDAIVRDGLDPDVSYRLTPYDGVHIQVVSRSLTQTRLLADLTVVTWEVLSILGLVAGGFLAAVWWPGHAR